MKNAEMTNSNTLPNKVKIDLNVLGALMLSGVGTHVDSTNVVTIDQSAAANWNVQLKKQ
jgi:hypothetical protein